MAWGKKDEELPDRLKGKTPEQVAQELEASDALKVKVTELETENAQARSRFESFSTEMNGKFDTLMSRIPEPKKADPQAPADFILDPDRAFAERAAPLAGLTLQTAAVVARQAAMQKMQGRQKSLKNNIDGLLFEKFGDEIDAMSKSVPATQLANPETWEHLFFNVKGRHTDDIVGSVRDGKNDFFVEGAKPGTGTGDEQPDKLNAQELRICEKMGLKPDAYLAQKKKMVLGVPDGVLN